MHSANCTAISVAGKTNCGFTKTQKKQADRRSGRQTDRGTDSRQRRQTEVAQLNADTKRISINVINLPDDLTNCETKPPELEILGSVQCNGDVAAVVFAHIFISASHSAAAAAAAAAAVIIARIARGTPRAFIKKESKERKREKQVRNTVKAGRIEKNSRHFS